MIAGDMASSTFFFGNDDPGSHNPWQPPNGVPFGGGFRRGGQQNLSGQRPTSVAYNGNDQSSFNPPARMASSASSRSDADYGSAQRFNGQPPQGPFNSAWPPFGTQFPNPPSQGWDSHDRFAPTDSMEPLVGSPGRSDRSLERSGGSSSPDKGKAHGKGRSQRRPSNRDEFDGPHQYLSRPAPEVLAMQERELPHLPTHLLVQEQDEILTQVNDRLSQCAFDFVAKYQFPIPLTQDMRPVERAQDREWTEWVYLLKRLATKRRIPARLLYNNQIKQFVTILENSLEMRHAAKHQSRPLKDDRNILQLISAGIQVAKILKDAQAMEYLDRLYVMTERQIQDRASAGAARFRS